MANFDLSELGPLPIADRSAELERISLNKLKEFLPSDRFLVRDERVDDAGVDASLELLNPNGYTNLRSQIQLKATDNQKANTDGSISLQVAVSNINYLLNGLSPLYILYVASRNEFRFLWAHEERRRLDQTNVKWMSQQNVTLRFKDTLTVHELDKIYGRILLEGRLHRKIKDNLASASFAEDIAIHINPETLAITDSDQVFTELEKVV